MKLPTDKKERRQMLILMGIVAAGVIYAIVHFVVLPFISSQKEIPEKLDEALERMASAERTVAAMPANAEQYNAAVSRVLEIADEYFLQPVLGSYILEAERIIEEHAQAVGLTIRSYREDGIRDLPQPQTRGPGNRLRSYTLIVDLTAGYDDLIRLVEEIETGNPFVSVLEINITSQTRLPEIHAIRFKVQWPIWGANEELPSLRTVATDETPHAEAIDETPHAEAIDEIPSAEATDETPL